MMISYNKKQVNKKKEYIGKQGNLLKLISKLVKINTLEE